MAGQHAAQKSTPAAHDQLKSASEVVGKSWLEHDCDLSGAYVQAGRQEGLGSSHEVDELFLDFSTFHILKTDIETHKCLRTATKVPL